MNSIRYGIFWSLVASSAACGDADVAERSGEDALRGPGTGQAAFCEPAEADLCGELPQQVGEDGEDVLTAVAGSCLIGRRSADLLTGSDANDVLVGGKGFDTLYGKKGDDTLVGGAGKDTLEGGEGNDLYLFYPADDQLNITDTITDPSGTDTVKCMGGLTAKSIMKELNGDVVLTFQSGVLRLVDGMRFNLVGCGVELPPGP